MEQEALLCFFPMMHHFGVKWYFSQSCINQNLIEDFYLHGICYYNNAFIMSEDIGRGNTNFQKEYYYVTALSKNVILKSTNDLMTKNILAFLS